MLRNPFIALWQDWITDPARELFWAISGAIRFTLINLRHVPAFVDRHFLHPPRVHMFPERLYALVSRLIQANVVIVVVVGAAAGRVLNGGLIFLPFQRLAFTLGLRGPLVNLTIDHLVTGAIAVLLIARAGTGLAVRATLGRRSGVWPDLHDAAPAALARASDLLVLPRALAVGLTGGVLAALGILALMGGFAFQWQSVRFASIGGDLTAGLKDFINLTGAAALAVCLVKTAFTGAAIGFVSCYEGLTGPRSDAGTYEVVGRTFSSSLAAWIIIDVWMSLLVKGLGQLHAGSGG